MTRTARPIRIEGDVAYVPLTKGYEAIIDVADIGVVFGFNWCAVESRSTAYAVRNSQNGNKKHIRMHRVILGAAENGLVDHVDGNGLNNRRDNLRLATRSENQRNRPAPKHNTTGIKGVSWCGTSAKWRACIAFDGRFKSLGYFPSKEEAALAYKKASEEFHGKFGRLA
jgi:hypothetical protein